MKVTAEAVQGREADGPRLVALEDREVGQGQADLLRQFGEGDLALEHYPVEVDLDRHLPLPPQTLRSRSSWRAAP